MVKNYQQGKIYKIVCNTTGLVYVGSTCEPYLSRRLSNHVSNYKAYLKGKNYYTSSFSIIEKGNYEILLMEYYPCQSSDELRMRERYHIESLECVNIRKRPHITIEDIREKNRIYSNNNKEKQALRNKIWRENNVDYDREQSRIRMREYRKTHKAEMNKINRDSARRKSLYLQQLKYYNV